MVHVLLVLGCAVVIYAACEWFVNAVEWLGARLQVGSIAVGSILAAGRPVLSSAFARQVELQDLLVPEGLAGRRESVTQVETQGRAVAWDDAGHEQVGTRT